MSASTHPPPNLAPKPPADFQQLARRIARWTTNGLATAIVLAAGLGFGRQIMLWWHDGGSEAASTPVDSLADIAGVRELEFGAATAHLQTQIVLGDQSAALAALRRLVRRVDERGLPPAREIGPAEARLLANIEQKLTPAERDQPRLDEFDEIMPTVVSSRPVSGENVQMRRRVTSLGFALPNDGGWTLYAFEFSGQSAGEAAADRLPIPPLGRRSLGIEQPDGGVVTAFHGLEGATLDAWQQFFAAELPRRGWRLAGDWTAQPAEKDAGRRAARYSRESGTSPARWLDVQFGRDQSGRLSGVLTLSPRAAKSGS